MVEFRRWRVGNYDRGVISLKYASCGPNSYIAFQISDGPNQALGRAQSLIPA
jgi:hypothetical protein